jgi:4-alpha-glucanotransferase
MGGGGDHPLPALPHRGGGLRPIRLGRDICNDLEAAERREWWLANGRGGYAGGTVAGSLTRRYHGLLIAPIDPPLGRVLVLTKADATATIGGRTYPLFTNRWASGSIAPDGYRLIEEFALDHTIPCWRFRCGDHVIEQRIWMEPGADTVYAAWRCDAPAALSIALLANGRDHHGDTWPDGFQPKIAADGARLTVAVPGRFALTILANRGAVAPGHEWYWDFDLPVERERGLNDRDAHLYVGDLSLSLDPGKWFGFAAGLSEVSADLDAALARRLAHDRAAIPAALAKAPEWGRRLALAADAFLVARPLPDVPNGKSVIAGYPWFGDWGRDTMISLPGLCLATGRFGDARTILDTFARFVDGGMIPNLFPENRGEPPEYNTADATLWYIEAWRAYVEAADDEAALRAVFPTLAGIIAAHQKGTRYGIGVDPADGLMRAGEPGIQLTWMDAKVGDRVITPRIGKPVEINALWFNALSAMAELAARIGESTDSYREAALRAKAGFARFAMPDGRGLYDVIDGPEGSGDNDASLRPNQIFAVSLRSTLLDEAMQRAVLDSCAPLVTPYGLRSLAPGSADYDASCRGGVAERDGAYHQGTVWAWLLGPYALAQYRVFGDATAAQRSLEDIAPHLCDAGLGTISEIFDADPPFTPRGCPAQAWSVACVLDAWWKLERAKVATAPSAPHPRRARRRS